MSEILDEVKQSEAELREWAEKNSDRQAARERMLRFADTLKSSSDEIIRLYSLTSALPPNLGNIHDLPQELLEELSVAKTDDLEDQIITVLNSYGGEASLDQILVGLFRKFEVIQKRRFLMNKLYRMPMVWSVDGRKGVYTTTKPDAVAEVNEFEEIAEKSIAEEYDFGETEDESEVPF